jgi:acetylornithine deacetylase/succinyl-diaminopimelate desuccinylase-like protein
MIDTIKTSGVGSTRYRVTYRGPGGHSWGDRGTPSAVHGLIIAAARLLATPAPEGLARNIGRMSGGTSINTIAAEATLELDLRAEAPGALKDAAATAREVLGAAPEGVTAEVELIGERPSGGLSADHPLIVAARAAREAVGLRPAQEGASSTDANAAYGAGVPAITVGLTTGANAHRVDEYIDLAPLSAGMAALTHLARALARG